MLNNVIYPKKYRHWVDNYAHNAHNDGGVMKQREIERILRDDGWEFVGQRGS